MALSLADGRPIYLEDRSGAELDDKCGMAYWFNRLEGGTGIVPKKEALALAIGRETHEDLARVAEMEDVSPEAIQEAIDEILRPLTDEDKQFTETMELLYRRLGWLAAFALYVEPKIRLDWEDIGIEKEIILDRCQLWTPTTPDRLLLNKKNGIIAYREYKTTINAGYKWSQSWRYAIQLHIGIAAAEEELGRRVHYGQIMGLLKGYPSTSGSHRLVHPYVWGYFNHQHNKWSAEYKSGMDWVPLPVWEYPGGVVKWVQFCGEEIAAQQFPHSPPVFLDKRMLDDWVERRTLRQKRIGFIEERARKDRQWRGIHFERRTNQCRPAFGDQCPYLLPCWNAEAEKDPLGTGEFDIRVPHHEVEITEGSMK